MRYIEKTIPEDCGYLIPIGDCHWGDKAFKDYGKGKLLGYLKWIMERPNAYVFLMGDIYNVSGRQTKTTPFETDTNEYEEAINFFEPYKERILGAIDGNHEYRMYDEFGISPMGIFCQALKIPYCKYSAVIRFKVGKRTDSHAGNRYNQNYFVFAHHCFDDQTELLTKSGWKKHNEFVVGEEVATLNIAAGLMQWNKINDIYKYTDFNKMVSIKTKTCDLVISHDHTIINRDRKSGEFSKKYAKDLIGKESNLPANAINNNLEYPIEDDLLKLLCWTITEGTRFSKKNSAVRITQSDKPKIDHYYILDIINRLSKRYDTKINVRLKYKKGFDGKINRNYDAYEIYINKCQLNETIKKLIPSKKIPEFFSQLSKRQFDIVLNELILGDGTIDKRSGCNGFSYFQKDENEIDKLQALCSINGYRTVKSKQQKWGGYPLSITPHQTHRIRKEAVKEINYKGVAWCVSVNNETLFVRRNGRVSITGNTTGGGSTIGGKMNRVAKERDMIEGCDVYLGAHNHQLGVVPQDIFYPSIQGGILRRRIWFVDCGSFLEWKDSYAEKGMLAPAKLGSPRIRMSGKQDDHDVHISL